MGLSNLFAEFTPVKGEHYLFLLHRDIPSGWGTKLPAAAEMRWLQIHHTLQIDSQQTRWLEPFPYFVSSRNECHGRASSHSLVCVAPPNSSLEKPFAHEETHAVVFRRWGKLPSFLTEGLAVYVERRVTSYGHALGLHRGLTAAHCVPLLLDLKAEWADILRKDELFWRFVAQGTPMYLIAECFVDFLVETRGFPFLHELLEQVRAGNDFVRAIGLRDREIARSWRQFVARAKP